MCLFTKCCCLNFRRDKLDKEEPKKGPTNTFQKDKVEIRIPTRLGRAKLQTSVALPTGDLTEIHLHTFQD